MSYSTWERAADPEETLDYVASFETELDELSDTIDSVDEVDISAPLGGSAPTQPSAAVKDATSKKVIFWVTGGTVGYDYLVKVTVTTAGGRTLVRSAWLKVRDQ